MTLDNSGNLTLPGNTFAVNYANGTQVSIGSGGNASTGNVTFNNQIVIGTGDGFGDGGLYLAVGPTSVANLQYLQVRGGDVATHIHLDTGNSDFYDQYFGDDNKYVKLEAAGNVQIGSNDDTGNSAQWTFGVDGNLTLPGNIIAINYANGNRVTGGVTFDGEAVIGTGTSNTQSGLYLAPDPVSLTNDLYLRVRGNINDEPTHIHFDTGNNQYYNQFIGDDNKYIQLANTGNIVINSNDGVGNAGQWIFATTGNLTAPGNISAVGNVTGGNLVTAGSGGNITLTGGNITGVNNISTGTITLTNGAVIKDTATYAVAFGKDAGLTSQGQEAVAVGHYAGRTSQGNGGVAIGVLAGNSSQGQEAVAVGIGAGRTNQGVNSVAIGSDAGRTDQGNNSIIINATGSALNQTVANTFTVAPVRNDNSNIAEVMFYNTTSKEVTYGNTISVAGNITAANFFGNGNTLSNVATTFESTWTVPTGNSTQSFTVNSGTYSMWVDCNITNGILVWNATATVTNTNVPVVGVQYAWVYNGGGTPVDFTSIPDQFTGTANTIVRSNVAPSATTNRFDFGINNTSGGNVTVRYGWAQIS
jgi:hypothetical protein